jgi:hypothetical protein
MKHCNVDIEQEKILDDNGAFFAFSSDQFNACANRSINYKSLGGGLYCPENNIDDLVLQLKDSHTFKINWELSNNTLKDIIWDQLGNYEAQITGDIDDACDALKPYGISEDDIKKEWPAYYQNCIDNDYF